MLSAYIKVFFIVKQSISLWVIITFLWMVGFLSKINTVRQVVHTYIMNMDCDINTKMDQIIHANTVAAVCCLLAKKRGLNVDIALITGYLHDVGKFVLSKSRNHAETGSKIVYGLLRSIKEITDEEIEVICCAIERHDKKNIVDDPYEEIIKDADSLAPYLINYEDKITKNRQKRLKKIFDEFEFTLDK